MSNTNNRNGRSGNGNKRPKFHCKNEKQRKAIVASYARRAAEKKKQEQQRVEAPYPHFRYYKKSGHPALIVGEQVNDKDVEEYKYRKVMHGRKDGKRTNEEVNPNPKPGESNPMYIGKRIRHDEKNSFEPRPLPWKYPPKNDK